MEYRRFGKTELQMPVLTCGGMRFQESWNSNDDISDASQVNLEACVRRAFDNGINHFETARGYGTSEEQLGRILPQLPRDEIIVQTKVGGQKKVQEFVDIFEYCMSLLKLDYIDIFSFHGINNDECLEHALICLEQAQQWKKQGRIRHIGFSSHGTADILIKAIETDAFEHMNLHWFYIYQDNWAAIEEARKRDMGVFIISPNDKAGLLYKPSGRLVELTAPLHPMSFNDLFCLSHPEVHTLSMGVSKPEDFDIHLEAVELLEQAPELLPEIEARLVAAMEEAVGKEWLDTWRHGLPEWYDTPGEINIPWVLRLRNLVLAYDMVEFGKMRYNLLGNGGHWFPGSKADKLSELDLTDCLKNSPHAAVIPKYLAETHEWLAGEERKRLQQDD